MEEKKKISTTFARIGSMGKSKIITIPKSIKDMNAGDEVLIIKMNMELIDYLKKLVEKDFVKHNIKLEWIDYLRRKRFS